MPVDIAAQKGGVYEEPQVGEPPPFSHEEIRAAARSGDKELVRDIISALEPYRRIPLSSSFITLKFLIYPSCFSTLTIASFTLDKGMSTLLNLAILPFLILVSISAMGSVILIL